MYAKLIKCDVPANKRQQFSDGQKCWSKTANASGFIKQFRGWDGDQAIILALWQDKASVEHFMRTMHDPIAEKANQADSYSSIDVSYLNQVFEIPVHSYSEKSKPQFIRIADCKLIDGKEQEFLDTQQKVWNTGMSSVKGMLGGYVWQFVKEPLRYLVTTFWESETTHQYYMQEHFPLLKEVTNAKTHINELSGCFVGLQNNWMIQAP